MFNVLLVTLVHSGWLFNVGANMKEPESAVHLHLKEKQHNCDTIAQSRDKQMHFGQTTVNGNMTGLIYHTKNSEMKACISTAVSYIHLQDPNKNTLKTFKYIM